MKTPELPTPDWYFKRWHSAVEVVADRVRELRAALVPACTYGDIALLNRFLQDHSADEPARTVQWLEGGTVFEDPRTSPARLVGLCRAPGADVFGLRGFGTLIDSGAGEPLLPSADAGRFHRWLALGLDGYFAERSLSARAAADDLASEIDESWADDLESWYVEQEPSYRDLTHGPGTASELARRTAAAWSAALPARVAEYVGALAPLAARQATILTWYDDNLGR
jgi:hypothetical protein